MAFLKVRQWSLEVWLKGVVCVYVCEHLFCPKDTYFVANACLVNPLSHTSKGARYNYCLHSLEVPHLFLFSLIPILPCLTYIHR